MWSRLLVFSSMVCDRKPVNLSRIHYTSSAESQSSRFAEKVDNLKRNLTHIIDKSNRICEIPDIVCARKQCTNPRAYACVDTTTDAPGVSVNIRFSPSRTIDRYPIDYDRLPERSIAFQPRIGRQYFVFCSFCLLTIYT